MEDPARSSRKLIAQQRRGVWGGPSIDEEARAHFQERLNVYAKTLFWSFVSLIVFLWLAYELVLDQKQPIHSDLVFGFSAVMLAVMAFIWRSVLARRRQLTSPWLFRLDLAFAGAIGLTFGVTAVLQPDLQAAAYTSLIFACFTVFTRALLVPSGARRTVVVSIITFTPVLAGGVWLAMNAYTELPPPALIGGGITFCAIATLIAANGSAIIYGLRRDVMEAKRLGQYTLGQRIGEGGIGAVYKASHALLRRATAIKLLKPSRNTQDDLERFEREVQHMSQLTHPNTVAVFDYGRSARGEFYYAMEYLDGIDLDVLVKNYGKQPSGRVIEILKQVCGALQEAHGNGLIHRDIKPANIILCERGGMPDVAKVVDFGLVREFLREESNATNAQHILGTPQFLAPEMVTDPNLLGPAVDLYALGATAFYLLTGEQVFKAKTSIEVMMKHVSDPPRRPSEVAEIHLAPELEELIMQCLEKPPSKRPASAAVLLEALEAIPKARDWARGDAELWWRDFRAKPPAVAARATIDTITVDLEARVPDGPTTVASSPRRASAKR